MGWGYGKVREGKGYRMGMVQWCNAILSTAATMSKRPFRYMQQKSATRTSAAKKSSKIYHTDTAVIADGDPIRAVSRMSIISPSSRKSNDWKRLLVSRRLICLTS